MKRLPSNKVNITTIPVDLRNRLLEFLASIGSDQADVLYNELKPKRIRKNLKDYSPPEPTEQVVVPKQSNVPEY